MMKNKHLFALLVLLIFIAGLGIRVYDLTDEPLESHIVRQLRSLLITRSLYQGKGMGGESLIELPIMELAASSLYHLAGQEIPWVQRIISISFWMLGGWALFELGKTISSRFGAVISIVYYLFLPFSIISSRFMMPDPMMTASTIIAVWTLTRWEKQRTMGWAIAAGLITGYAILAKSVAGFILLPAFALFTLAIYPIKTIIKERQLWAMVVLAALPSLVYYVYGIFIRGTLAGQFQNRFFLDLLMDPSHYVRWINTIDNKFGLGVVMLALVGSALVKDKPYQRLLAGWWLGYVFYGLVFPYHIWTHDYYHLPLVPIVALSLAPLGTAAFQAAKEMTTSRRLSTIVIGLALLIYSATNIWNARVALASEDFRQEGRHYQPIKEALAGHLDEEMISLSGDYNVRLSYFTQLEIDSWPNGADLRLRELSNHDFDFEQFWNETANTYRFFLILSQNELESQEQLAVQLNAYPVFYQGGGVTIYDLQHPLDTNPDP